MFTTFEGGPERDSKFYLLKKHDAYGQTPQQRPSISISYHVYICVLWLVIEMPHGPYRPLDISPSPRPEDRRRPLAGQ